MSKDVFDSLTEGMAYLQVRKLVGGTEHTSRTVAYESDPRYHSYKTIYVLGYRGNGGPGSMAVLTFAYEGIATLSACRLIGMQAVGLR